MNGSQTYRIGVLGGSFDPPTRGHYSALKQAANHFEELVVVPNVCHAFGKALTPLSHRFRLLELFVESCQSLSRPVSLSLIEEALYKIKEGPVYTYEVMKALTDFYSHQGRKSFQLRFIVGPDIADPKVWHRFYRYRDIEAQWPLYVVKEQVSLHSSDVRAFLQKKTSSKERLQHLIEWVGDPIAAYIMRHQLYAGGAHGRSDSS